MMIRFLIFGVLVTGLFTGCSSIKIYGDETHKKEIGVTYYEPAFYLLVTRADTNSKKVTENTTGNSTETQAKVVYTAKLITMPDYTKPRYIVPKYGYGSLNWSVELTDGWRLKNINGNADPQVDETLTALASFLPSIGVEGAAAAEALDGDGEKITDGLYRIDFENETLHRWKVKDITIEGQGAMGSDANPEIPTVP